MRVDGTPRDLDSDYLDRVTSYFVPKQRHRAMEVLGDCNAGLHVTRAPGMVRKLVISTDHLLVVGATQNQQKPVQNEYQCNPNGRRCLGSLYRGAL
jgi:hypothetical protein